MFAEVIIDVKNKQVNRSFDYKIPSYLEDIISIGTRVKVPFGSLGKRTGYVVGLKDTTEVKKGLREIDDIIDVKPVLNQEFVDMAKYIANHDFSFYATSLETMIPTALRMKYQKIARLVNDDIEEELKVLFKRKKEVSLSSVPKELEPVLFNEVKKGNLVLDTKMKKVRLDKYMTMVHVLDYSGIPNSKKGVELLSYLEEIGDDVEEGFLLTSSGYTKSVLDTLIKNEFVATYKVLIEPEEDIHTYSDKEVSLNSEQENVLNKLKFNEPKTYLLHGVTGSGKTELYMRWISECINNGKTALMLVPEISLTPQITAVFYARFKESIAVLHSRLSITEKYDEWKRILNGDVKIVVGARSAIFAPLKNLGIIIVDECHESSYKQQNNPKYDAIDLAKIRSNTHNCPLVLGSATPDAKEYYRALNGDYELLSLPNRANGKMLPPSKVIDMREELKNGNRTPISDCLKDKIIKCYRNKEQSILFLNRRGYSSFVQCRSCGTAVKCPHCDVSLTYHSRINILKCHYCGYQQMNVTKCDSCGSDKIRFVGSGTEKVYEAVAKILPEAKIIRLDTDTISNISDYEKAYHDFKNHDADIMIGTQMVTKGLDFEGVTLVGVLNADLALHYPTYDASQVAFNLIEQVSGRAGRSKLDGEVIIQTYNPESFVIKTSSKHDYLGFYNKEILKRRAALMPPFAEVIEIEISGYNKNEVLNEAKNIALTLKNQSKDSVVLGPTEAYIFKKKDIYHYQITVQAIEDKLLDAILALYPQYQDNKKISVSIARM